MTTVTDTRNVGSADTPKTPMMNDPFIAYNLITPEVETPITEIRIKLGWNRFGWLESRKDKSFTTSTGLTFRVGTQDSYDASTRVLSFTGHGPTKLPCLIPNIRLEFYELCAAWQLEQTGIQDKTMMIVNESVLSVTKKNWTGHKIQLYTSHAPGHSLKFEASNGWTVLIGLWSDIYCRQEKRLYVTTTTRVTEITSSFPGFTELIQDWDSVRVALDEFDVDKTESVKVGSTDFSGWTYPGIVNVNPSSVTITPVHLTMKLYRYVMNRCEDHRFTATNEIVINCSAGNRVGYASALYFNLTVVGRDWIPDTGRAVYKRDLTKIQVALKELEDKYAEYKKNKKPVHITAEVYNYAKKHCSEFTASNGIVIHCTDQLCPQFEDPKLVVDFTVIDRDWVPMSGRAAYVGNVDRVLVAVQELTTKCAEYKKNKRDALLASLMPQLVVPVTPAVVAEPVLPIPSDTKSKVSTFAENITLLTEIGFSRDDAIRGLVESGNDFVEAAKKLLHA